MVTKSRPKAGTNEPKWPDDFIAAARASGGGAPGVMPNFDMVVLKLAELVVMIDAVRRNGGFAPPEPPVGE